MFGLTNFDGRGPANSTVELLDENDEIIAAGMVDDEGHWALHGVELPAGENFIIGRLSAEGSDPRYGSLTVNVPERADDSCEQVWLSETELKRISDAAIAELTEHAEQCRQEYKSHAGAI